MKQTIINLLSRLNDWLLGTRSGIHKPRPTEELDLRVALTAEYHRNRRAIAGFRLIQENWIAGIGFGLTTSEEKLLADLIYRQQVIEIELAKLDTKRAEQ